MAGYIVNSGPEGDEDRTSPVPTEQIIVIRNASAAGSRTFSPASATRRRTPGACCPEIPHRVRSSCRSHFRASRPFFAHRWSRGCSPPRGAMSTRQRRRRSLRASSRLPAGGRPASGGTLACRWDRGRWFLLRQRHRRRPLRRARHRAVVPSRRRSPRAGSRRSYGRGVGRSATRSRSAR